MDIDDSPGSSKIPGYEHISTDFPLSAIQGDLTTAKHLIQSSPQNHI